jgi:hypothetical protein
MSVRFRQKSRWGREILAGWQAELRRHEDRRSRLEREKNGVYGLERHRKLGTVQREIEKVDGKIAEAKAEIARLEAAGLAPVTWMSDGIGVGILGLGGRRKPPRS